MTIGMRPICVDCVHLRKGQPGVWGLYCDAYPDQPGIPDAILHTRVDHRQAYASDRGIQFALIDDAAARDAAHIIQLALRAELTLRAHQAPHRQRPLTMRPRTIPGVQ